MHSVENTVNENNLVTDGNLTYCGDHLVKKRNIKSLYWASESLYGLLVLWRPTRPSITNTQKRCTFHYSDLEWKSRMSRNSWSNRQIWPWSIEWSTAKANRVLPREYTGHSKHPLQQHKIRLYTWHHQMVNTKIRLIIFFADKDGEALYNQQKQDQELTVAQNMNSLLPNSDLQVYLWRIHFDIWQN